MGNLSPNHYELAIKSSKDLEHILEEDFGASGKGLHEKVSSVESKLPAPLVKRLRFIATIRNKLIHDTDFERIPDVEAFTTSYNQAKAELISISNKQHDAPSSCIIS